MKITYIARDGEESDMSYIQELLTDEYLLRLIYNNRKVTLEKPDGVVVVYEGYMGDD